MIVFRDLDYGTPDLSDLVGDTSNLSTINHHG